MAAPFASVFGGHRLPAGTGVFFLLLVAVGLVGIFSHFLLFHTLAELFSIAIAGLAGVVAWYTHRFFRNPLFLFLGCAYPWIGLIDLLHTVSYTGMGLFPHLAPNLPTQLWVVARLFEAVVLLMAAGFIDRPVHPGRLLALFGGITAAALVWVASGWFPVAFVAGQGLTPFKVGAEYLIIGLLCLALVRFTVRRRALTGYLYALIAGAIVLTVAAESFFASYAKVDDWLNGLGHLFKALSYWLIFLGVVRTSLLEPLQERTRVLDHANEGLFLIDAETGHIVYANRAGRRLFREFGEAPPSSADAAPALTAGMGWTRLLAQVRSGGGRLYPYQTEGDGTRPLELSYHLVEDAPQTYVVATARDITARVRVTRERDRLAAILEATPDLVGVADAEGNIDFVNRAARETLGLDPAAVRVTLADLHPPEMLAHLRDKAIPAAIRDGHWSGENVLLTAAGDPLPVWQTIIAHRGRNGALEYLSTVCHDITELKTAQQELARLATIDYLTGIYNRQKTEQLLAEELARASRYPGGFALLMFDIDHFKSVNDAFGHEAGDATLKALVRIVRRQLRATDAFGRWGGEEFMILAPETDRAGGMRLAEKLRAVVADTPVDPIGRITISIGVAEFRPGEGAADLLRRVDEALYRAKDAGRNRVCEA